MATYLCPSKTNIHDMVGLLFGRVCTQGVATNTCSTIIVGIETHDNQLWRYQPNKYVWAYPPKERRRLLCASRYRSRFSSSSIGRRPFRRDGIGEASLLLYRIDMSLSRWFRLLENDKTIGKYSEIGRVRQRNTGPWYPATYSEVRTVRTLCYQIVKCRFHHVESLPK